MCLNFTLHLLGQQPLGKLVSGSLEFPLDSMSVLKFLIVQFPIRTTIDERNQSIRLGINHKFPLIERTRSTEK
jgi:hypothetical protein